MPLMKGSSQETISANISELYDSFIKRGYSKKKAQKMAVAASMRTAAKSKKK